MSCTKLSMFFFPIGIMQISLSYYRSLELFCHFGGFASLSWHWAYRATFRQWQNWACDRICFFYAPQPGHAMTWFLLQKNSSKSSSRRVCYFLSVHRCIQYAIRWNLECFDYYCVLFWLVNLLFFRAFRGRGFIREIPVPGPCVSSVQPYPYPERLRFLYNIHTLTRTFNFRYVVWIHTKIYTRYKLGLRPQRYAKIWSVLQKNSSIRMVVY